MFSLARPAMKHKESNLFEHTIWLFNIAMENHHF
jgi:hypothetical protein